MAQSHPDCGWIYQCDDILVEPRAHRLERAGKAIAVEPKAYAVLVVLLQQAGEVVGKDTLLDTAWGHRHVTPGVLTRVISQLRHALGDCASQPRYIATVHSLGYRFVGEVHRTLSAALPAYELLPDVASNDELAEVEDAAASTAPRRPFTRWLAAVITLMLIVALVAAASLWHSPVDAGLAPHATAQAALATVPLARQRQAVPSAEPSPGSENRRVTRQCPGDHDDRPAQPRAAGI